MLPGWLWEKVTRLVQAVLPSARRRGPRASARARTASPRSDVAAAAGRITLLALCWYPFETGLRREALEVPAVVTVGSAHSQRRLSHGAGGRGAGGGEARSPNRGDEGRRSLAGERESCIAFLRHPSHATLSAPPRRVPVGAPEAPNVVICFCDEWHRNSGCCGKFGWTRDTVSPKDTWMATF